MPLDLLKQQLDLAGVSRVFAALDLSAFLQVLEEADVDQSLVNGSFHRFLESLLRPYCIPATWQKLADLGWSDDEVAGLVDGNLLQESPISLLGAIGLGALSVAEYAEFSRFPNQEVDIFFYSSAVKQVLAWLNKKTRLPRVSEDAFSRRS